MKQNRIWSALAAAVVMAPAASAFAAGFPALPVMRCANDAVLAGTVCLDRYEATVWRVPAARTTNAGLVRRIQLGKATAADLAAGGATQLGIASNDYAPCTETGQHCAGEIYAVSLAGATPSANISWFQAQEACANSLKRLPTNAEWQVGANGPPDTGGADDGTTDCNTDNLAPGITMTGSRSGCVSARGAFDMVGNVYEWVADWVPHSTNCTGWGSASDDNMCLAGASTNLSGPGALLRGGDYGHFAFAGPLTVIASFAPTVWGVSLGFRCAR